VSEPRSDATSSRPLAGRTVVITRAAEQSAALSRPFEELGAVVVLLPVIRVIGPSDWAPVDRAIAALDSYDWVVLTSTNGVDAFIDRLSVAGRSIDALAAAKVAAVGSATAAHLEQLGIETSLVPGIFRAEGVVAAFEAIGTGSGRRILIPRAEEAREVLPDDLRALGFEVDVVPTYRIATAEVDAEALRPLAGHHADAVVFASGGTARRFVEVLGNAGLDPHTVLEGVLLASIGPVTTEALVRLGLRADIEAAEATSAALVEAVVAGLSGRSS
jgi:uroporphyrinogen III methyltransferase/synthase